MPIQTLRFLHISDTHMNPDTDYIKDYAQYTPLIGVQALVREINQLPFQPDFILHTGDVAYDPAPDVYHAVREVFADVSAPIYYLAGNHDDAQALQRDLLGRSASDIQAMLYGTFTVKGVQVVYLDSNGPHDPTRPSGTVTQDQLDWLDTICTGDDEQPLVIAVHHNVLPCYVPWVDEWMRMENGEAFHEVVRQARDRLCGVFHGHIHQNMQVVRDGVLYVSSGSSWCQFSAYPDASNQRLIHNAHTLPSFNMVTIGEAGTSIIRHSLTV
ncbi:MAG: metallophosphoesterase family protein [Anaerolineae bacterium]